MRRHKDAIDGFLERAQVFRERAREIRSFARTLKASDARQSIALVADEYDQMAEKQEELAKEALAPFLR